MYASTCVLTTKPSTIKSEVLLSTERGMRVEEEGRSEEGREEKRKKKRKRKRNYRNGEGHLTIKEDFQHLIEL